MFPKAVLFAVEALQRVGDWDRAATLLAAKARQIESAGADMLLICTNTMHKVADEVSAAIDLPLLHIAHATARAVLAAGAETVGLLGTRYTMEQDFYIGRLREHGLSVVVPTEADREIVNRVIFEELCLGETRDDSRAHYLRIVDELASRGAEAVIEGCTEIGMLIKQQHTAVPLFDTTAIHARAAVSEALADN